MGLAAARGPSGRGWSWAQGTSTTMPRITPAQRSLIWPWRSTNPKIGAFAAGGAGPLTGVQVTAKLSRTRPSRSTKVAAAPPTLAARLSTPKVPSITFASNGAGGTDGSRLRPPVPATTWTVLPGVGESDGPDGPAGTTRS